MDDGNDAIPQKISHNIKKESTLKILYEAGTKSVHRYEQSHVLVP